MIIGMERMELEAVGLGKSPELKIESVVLQQTKALPTHNMSSERGKIYHNIGFEQKAPLPLDRDFGIGFPNQHDYLKHGNTQKTNQLWNNLMRQADMVTSNERIAVTGKEGSCRSCVVLPELEM